jgi:hypothetical protein
VNRPDTRLAAAHCASSLLILVAACLLLGALPVPAETNFVSATNHPGAIGTTGSLNTQAQALDVRAERIRTACVQGRRVICGKVMEIATNGLVVDSGYTGLMNPPFTKSWRIRGTVPVSRDASAVELNTPGAPCIGLVFLTRYPKRPAIKLYDYVSILAYPAGQYSYVPVPAVKKQIRRFAGSLETAINLNLEAEEAQNPPARQEAK